MAKVLITRQFLEWLSANKPGAFDVIYRDTKQSNFGVRASPGAISFFVQRKMGGSTSFKRTLGTYPDLPLEMARKRALVWLGWMAEGKDPLLVIKEQRAATQEAQEKNRRTFGKVFDDYAAIKRKNSATATIMDREKIAKKLAATKLWHVPFDEITVDIVDAAISKEMDKHLATAWRIYRYARAAYAFEADKLQISGNPFSLWRKWKAPQEVARREGVLPTSDAAGQKWLRELVKLREHEQASVAVTADYLLCLLLWGGRKTETQKLTIADVKFKDRMVVFRGRNTKNKRDHYFPLTPWAAEIVKARIEKNGERKGNWVFPSRIEGKSLVEIRPVLAMLEKASGLAINAHDLRRTFASELTGETNANLFLVKSAMNHAGVTQDVTVGYIAIKAKVDALRPAYEARERRLRKLSGSATPVEALPKSIQVTLKSAAKNPELRNQLLEFLQKNS